MRHHRLLWFLEESRSAVRGIRPKLVTGTPVREQKGTEARVVATSPISMKSSGVRKLPLPHWSGFSLEHSVASYDWLRIHGLGIGSLYKLRLGNKLSSLPEAASWSLISWESPCDSVTSHPFPPSFVLFPPTSTVTDLLKTHFKNQCMKMLWRCDSKSSGWGASVNV